MNEEEMKLFKLIKKPLNEMVFFIVCLICIVPPTINHFLILFRDIEIDILVGTISFNSHNRQLYFYLNSVYT